MSAHRSGVTVPALTPVQRASRAAAATPEQLAAIGSTLAWDGRKLRVDVGNELTAQLRRKRWSASSSDTIASCPAKFVAERLIPETPDPFGPAELGGAVHALFEDLLALPQGQRSIEAFESFLADIETRNEEIVFPDDDPDLIAEWRQEVRLKGLGLWKIVDPDDLVVAPGGIELPVEGVIEGVPVIGYIDLAALGADGTSIRINDYKTGSFKKPNPKFGDKYGDQMRLYKVLLNQMGHEVEAATLWFTAAGKSREIDLSDRAVARTIKEFIATWDKLHDSLDRGWFATKAGNLCPWCPLALVCPTAAANDYPRNDKGRTAALVKGQPGLALNIAGAVVLPHTDWVKPTSLSDPESTEPPPEPIRLDLPKQKENAMSSTDKLFGQAQPWEEIVPGTDTLNGNAYAAVAAFATVQLAVELLTKHEQKLTRTGIEAMAATLEHVVDTVQRDLANTASRNAGINTRLRGALRTALDISGHPPFGCAPSAWEGYVDLLIRRVTSIALAAHTLWDAEPAQSPWLHFAAEQAKSA